MIIYILVLICFLCTWIIYQKQIRILCKPKTKHTLTTPTIVSYNIQKFLWSCKSFKTIRQFLSQHSIILLQECYDETLESLDAVFPEYYICRGTMKGLSMIHGGLAILSTYPIISYEYIPFIHYNPLTFDRLTEKGFLIVTIDVDGKKLNVINTHLQSSDYERYDHYAFMQFKELLEYVVILQDAYIIGGDFNIDITDLKKRHQINLYYPLDPTIYMNLKTGHSVNKKERGYEGFIFDYFITKDVSLDPETVPHTYSDHNPVRSLIKLAHR